MSEAVTTRQQELAGKYRPYPEYKDSGVEWLQLCPSSWETKALKYIVSCNDEVLSESTDPDMEFEYIDIGGVSSSEGITRTESMRFSGAPSRARRIVRQGDIIVSTVRTYLEAIAPISLEFDGKIASTGFAVLRPKYLLSGFAKYALRARHFIDSVVARSTGVSYPAINSSELIDIKIVVPSLKEQQTIASFLDYETARIDRLIAQQQRLIELLKEKRQAVISHAVTKGLNPNAPMKDSGVEWLGQVPEHWDVCLIKFKCDGVTDGAHISPVTEGGQELFVSIKDIEDGKIDFDNALLTSPDSYQYLVKTGCQPFAGDILFSKDGTIGQTAVTPEGISFVVASSLIIIRPNRDVVRPSYLNFLLQSCAVKEQVESFVKGAALRRLSIQNLLKVFGAFPDVYEQDAISRYLGAVLANYSELESKAREAISLMQERRTALISAAVTGKIDLRGWTQPAEEVAA
ncbi:restriction endonuclease subunit S [Aeromonas sp. QDB08]|uniref:restriction endonuclease subunit S n=1 Tax=Aeromonas sp. QDB08 TaxID=2990480 RepID=UPI0022E55776|nr:restriction endonuclease subunit S [Aeromonas sp. QDB08]